MIATLRISCSLRKEKNWMKLFIFSTLYEYEPKTCNAHITVELSFTSRIIDRCVSYFAFELFKRSQFICSYFKRNIFAQ